MAKLTPVPGTADIFAAEAKKYKYIEDCGAEIFSRYGYGELRTPIFEYTDLFQKGLGDDTEVVQKEMYTFLDRGGRSLTLRPEGTAGVMRALLNTDVMNGVEQRVFYHGPMFRGERPAAGRRRQFHQIGVENVGKVSPELDAECIAMISHFLDEIKLTDVQIRINTRGLMSDRIESGNALREYFSKNIDCMCDDCKTRLEKNIWRILDCKVEHCKTLVNEAPDYLQFFSEESREYFSQVCRTLDNLGVKYVVDPLLVRGLDYYVHTVFELSHGTLGEQIAIAGGGRYELFLPGNNRPLQGVGFAAGIERLIMVQDELEVELDELENDKKIFLVGLGDEARIENIKLANILRKKGYTVGLEVDSKSMKAQMRSANHFKASKVIIRGLDELNANQVNLKNMATGEQSLVDYDELFNLI